MPKSRHAPACVAVSQWIAADFRWSWPSRSFEFRVDNQLLASWLNGDAACDSHLFAARLSCALDLLQCLVRHEKWQLRHDCSNWLRWVPRELNVLADALANSALDLNRNIALRGVYVDPSTCNFVLVSDGAARGSSGRASAAWVLLACLGKRFSVVAAGAVLLQAHASSMEAEFAGFELALGSLMRLSRGYANVVPHDVQTTLDLSEYMEDKRRLLEICT